MTRFNLVLHGMFACVEDQTNHQVRILVPDVPAHSYAHGEPHRFMGLRFMAPPGGFRLKGPTPSKTPLRDLVSPRDTVVLEKAKYDIDETKAIYSYTVPVPDAIRMYRAAEVSPSVLTSLQNEYLIGRPRLLHHMTVFSYINIPADVAVSDAESDLRIFNDPTRGTEAWCIYAQPDHTEQPHPVPGLCELFVRKSDKQYANLNGLSHPGVVDGSCNPASCEGLSATMAMTLGELKNAGKTAQTGGDVGCSKMFVVE